MRCGCGCVQSCGFCLNCVSVVRFASRDACGWRGSRDDWPNEDEKRLFVLAGTQF